MRRRVSSPASAPSKSTSSRSGTPSQQRGEHAAEALGDAEEGTNAVRGTSRGHVDGEGNEVPGEREYHLLGDLLASLVLGFARARTEMGRHDDIREPEQRRSRTRLGREDVERGPADMAGCDCVSQRLLVENPAAGGIDDSDAALGFRKQLLAEQPGRLRRLRQVDA